MEVNMKQPLFKSIFMISVISFAILGLMISTAISGGPADGYTIHVQAPHMMAE